MPGWRFDRSGAARQADRADGRRRRRRRPRPADPRAALPPHRTRRAGRVRRDPEVHGQHAADDLLAGLGRGACAFAFLAARSGAAHGPSQRHLRRPQRAQGARPGSCGDAQGRRRRPCDIQRRRRHQGYAVDARRSAQPRRRTAARRARAWPVTKRPSAIARAPTKSPPSRSIGRTAASGKFLPAASEPPCRSPSRKLPPSSMSR